MALGTLAWGLALVGLSLTTDEPGRTLAMLVLALAGVCALIAWSRMPLAPGLFVGNASQRARWGRGRVFRVAGIAGAAGLVALADWQFIERPNEAFGAAGWLWLAGMGMLLAATIGWPAERVADRAYRAVPWTRLEVGALGGLLVAALVLRVWNLQEIPFVIHPDEIFSGSVARGSFLDTPHSVSIFRTVWDGIDLPALWFVGLAAAQKVGGQWLAMVRLPAALFGAATVLPFYGMLRGAWGRAAALGGSAVLVFSAADVHYSRVTLPNIATPFFWAVCFFFLLRGLRRRRPVDWALAGLAAGLSEYGYYGTHLLPFVLLAFAAYLLVAHWREARSYLGYFGLTALGYLAAFGPLLAYFMRFRPDIYFGRAASQGAMMWDHLPTDAADAQRMWVTLWPLMAENLLGVSTRPSQDTVYAAPLLLVPEAAALVLGVALLVRQWRHPAAFLLLLSGVGVMIVGATLVHGVPFIAHWTPAFLAFYGAVGVAIGAWVGSWAGLRFRWRQLGAALLAGALLVDAAANVALYFGRYQTMQAAIIEPRTAQSRWEAALGSDYRVYTVGEGAQLYEPLTNSFLVHGQEGAALLYLDKQLPLPEVPGKGLAFVFYSDNDHYRPMIERLYPDGQEGEVRAPSGYHLFNTYRLSSRQVAAVPSRTAAEVQAIMASYLPLHLSMVRHFGGTPPWLEARGLGVLPDGAVVVGDSGHHRVMVYEPDGRLRHSWGAPGTGANHFDLIADLAVSPDGTIAVLDAANGDIQLFNADGQAVGRWLGENTGVLVASGLAWAPDGRSLYVASTSGGSVVHLGRDGALLGRLAEGSGNLAPLNQPLDVAALPDGSVYVTDLGGRVVRFDRTGRMDAEWQTPIGIQRGGNHLTVWHGRIAMTNPDSNTLQFLAPGTGIIALDAGDAANMSLVTPVGIATGPDGRLYVLSSADNRVVVLDGPP
ncbi:MAG: glycosyltransferase family 39 protein [Chloroflexia bacterium]